MPMLNPILRDLPATTPFVGPEAIERRTGKAFRLRLGANESAFGPSPKAVEAMNRALGQAAWYGDPESWELREALAERHATGLGEICVGEGIDSLLGLAVRMLTEPGAAVVTSRGAYPTFNYHVAGHGAELHAVPFREDKEDLDALLERVHDTGASLVYLSNPDNPMGTWHDADYVRAFLDALPGETVLILDEAYLEFGPEEADWPIDASDPRLLRMRTFSKAHGMAGARIGYCLGHRSLIESLGKIRNHFGVNRIAQAGALASLQDHIFLAEVQREVQVGRAEYAAMASSLGLQAIPSGANFVAIDVGSAMRAKTLLTVLERRGVFVRMPGVPPLDRCVRITVGKADERAMLRDILPDALRAVDAALPPAE